MKPSVKKNKLSLTKAFFLYPYSTNKTRKFLTTAGVSLASAYFFDEIPLDVTLFTSIGFCHGYYFTNSSVCKDINTYFKNIIKTKNKPKPFSLKNDLEKLIISVSLPATSTIDSFQDNFIRPINYLFDYYFQKYDPHYFQYYAHDFASTSISIGFLFEILSNNKDFFSASFFNKKSFDYYLSTTNYNESLSKEKINERIHSGYFSNFLKKIFFLDVKNYVEFFGYDLKNTFESKYTDSSMFKLHFINKVKENKTNNIDLFLISSLLNISPEIKEHYANKTIEDIIEGKYLELNEEDKSQILSVIPVYLENIGKDSKTAWEKYINFTKNNTKKLENLVSGGGTKGVFKNIISKQYEFPISDLIEVAHTSKDEKLIEGKYYQTKFLHETNDENNFFIYPKPLYLTKYNNESIYIERQLSWKNIDEYILSKKDITQEEIFQIFKDALETIKHTQDKLGKGIILDGKEFIFEKESMYNKYLTENRLLHPTLQNKKVIEQFITHIDNSNIPWKASVDPITFNFLVSDNYLLKFKNGEKRIAKIDNELSKLLPDAEHFKLLVYAHHYLSEEKFNKLFNPYIDNYDNQISLSAIMAQSYIRGFGKRKDFNLDKAKNFLTFNQKFIHSNLNNFSDKLYSPALNQIEELEKYKRNIQEIHNHILKVENKI
jgi:hypothetical protein